MAKRTGVLPPDELALFCDQLSIVLEAGLPLSDAMATLAENYAGTPNGARFAAVNAALQAHDTLKDALEQVGLFPPYLIGMVHTGEQAGRLDEVLAGLSRYYAREADIRAQIKSAVTYPSVLVLMMAAVIAVLVSSVMPVFARIYASLGTDLAANMTANVGIAAGRTVLIVIAALVALLLAAVILYNTRARGALLRVLGAVLPPLRRTEDALYASRFAEVMGLMLKSGCDLDEAMERTREIPGSDSNRAKAVLCGARMRSGQGFYEAVSAAEIFSPLHNKLIRTGVTAGKLDAVMEKLGQTYAEQAETQLARLVSAIEPTLVALLCVAIGGILLTVMLPLLTVLSSMA